MADKVMKTDPPFTGKYLHIKDKGIYNCATCGATLFSSEHKYDSTVPGLMGWPSFSAVAKSDSVKLIDDNSLGMHRIEVVCAKCGSHLGHIFDDRESKTGKHYCINSSCLNFQPKK